MKYGGCGTDNVHGQVEVANSHWKVPFTPVHLINIIINIITNIIINIINTEMIMVVVMITMVGLYFL